MPARDRAARALDRRDGCSGWTAKPITIRQMIYHTSGLSDQWQLLGLAGWRFPEDLITEDDVLGIIRRQQGVNFAPGAEWV